MTSIDFIVYLQVGKNKKKSITHGNYTIIVFKVNTKVKGDCFLKSLEHVSKSVVDKVDNKALELQSNNMCL